MAIAMKESHEFFCFVLSKFGTHWKDSLDYSLTKWEILHE